MLRVKIESLLLLAVVFAINWTVTFARNCGNDEFSDPFTLNCNPCGPVCAIGNCFSVCPNYVMPTSLSNTTTAETSSDNSLNTSQLLFIILPPVLFCFLLAIIVITIYTRYCKGNKKCCSRIVYINSIQESRNDSNGESITINIGIEDVSHVI